MEDYSRLSIDMGKALAEFSGLCPECRNLLLRGTWLKWCPTYRCGFVREAGRREMLPGTFDVAAYPDAVADMLKMQEDWREQV